MATRWLVLVMLAGVAACKTPNPDFCCVTEAQCAELGGDEIRPCRAGQACAGGTCVASECDTSADCMDPTSPVCINSLCVAKCSVDPDCAGAADGPYCADDGVCVGCTTNAECPSNAPFCDTEDRSCRGCEADADCTGGVCLEADGRCAADAEVIYVSSAGVDTGACTRAAPCRTLQYAIAQVAPARAVVHVDGGTLNLGADLTLSKSIYLDASNTTIRGDDSGPMITVDTVGSGPVTFSNITISTLTGPTISVTGTTSVRLYNATVTRPVETNGGAVTANDSSFIDGGVICMGGSVTVERSRFTRGGVEATNCQVTASRNQFEANSDDALQTIGGKVTFENNLVIQSYELADTLYVVNAAPGSTVRFNTVVNTSTVASDGVALYCDSTLDVTSNVFAYGSMHPHGGSQCAGKYSLYDSLALSTQTDGVGNKVTDGAAVFANKAARDFHLATTTPARNGAEPNLGVMVDLEGKPRPSPVGSNPDMGAFEAP